MTRQEKLEWLARNVHKWPDYAACATTDGSVPAYRFSFQVCSEPWVTRQEWLSMREKLQNKPKFADHPDAKCFVQNKSGAWCKNTKTTNVSVLEAGWNNDDSSCGWEKICSGMVIGDWRDTLEKRPESTSKKGQSEMTITTQDNENATQKEDIEDVIERIYWELDDERSRKLNPERDIFKRKVRHAIHMAREIDKQSENGKPQDNSWHDRGDRPPLGKVFAKNKAATAECANHDFHEKNIVAAGNDLVIFRTESGKETVGSWCDYEFRPLRTEREKAIDAACKVIGGVSEDGLLVIEKLYDAGMLK